MKKNLNVKIDEKLLERYMEFCKENGYAASKRIRNFIEKELESIKQTK